MSEVTEKQKFLDNAALCVLNGMYANPRVDASDESIDAIISYNQADALWNERQKRYGCKDV